MVATIDRITGRQIHLTNPDQSRTFVQIHVLENRLYIFEAMFRRVRPSQDCFSSRRGFSMQTGNPCDTPTTT